MIPELLSNEFGSCVISPFTSNALGHSFVFLLGSKSVALLNHRCEPPGRFPLYGTMIYRAAAVRWRTRVKWSSEKPPKNCSVITTPRELLPM